MDSIPTIRRLWYKNPLNFLPLEDWIDLQSNHTSDDDGWHRLKLAGANLLQDVGVKRAEYPALKRMLMQSANNFFRTELTDTQAEILALIQQAHADGVAPSKVTRYVAVQRGTGIRAAQRIVKRLTRLLENSNEAKMFAFPSFFDSRDRDVYELDIPETRVQAVLARLVTTCAGASRQCDGNATGRGCLCRACEREYGVHAKYWPEWLRNRVSELRSQLRHRAEEIVAFELYGIDRDISDLADVA